MMFVARMRGATLDHMGYIPSFLFDEDPRPAAVQINERYVHGGWDTTWSSQFVMLDGDVLQWPQDPPQYPICELRLRDERIVLYPASVVAIIQPDGSFEVSRLD